MRSVNVLIEINYWLNSFLGATAGAAVLVTPLLEPHNQYNAVVYWTLIPLCVFCVFCAFLATFARRAEAARHETLNSAEEHINELRTDLRDTNRQLISHKARLNDLEFKQKLGVTQLSYDEQVSNLASWCTMRSLITPTVKPNMFNDGSL